MEIYNEAVYDLLAPPEKRTKLRIREDTSGNVYVKVPTTILSKTLKLCLVNLYQFIAVVRTDSYYIITCTKFRIIGVVA